MRILIVLSLMIALTGCVSETQPGAFSSEFDQQEAAKTRVSLGLTYLKNGNYSQAKQNLDKALAFAPRLAETHYGLAYYYQVVGESERADESYQTAMSLAPRDANIANSYGAFLCQDGRYDEAKRFFMQAVNAKQYANSAETYENMALCAQSQGEGEDAIEYLNSALKHQPGRAKTLFILTEMYVATEQYGLAAETLRRYEKVARVSADSLWMAIEIAKGQGDLRAANGYGDMLLRMYPNSPLARLYIERQKTVPQPVVKVKTKPQSQAVSVSVSEKAAVPEPQASEAAVAEANQPGAQEPVVVAEEPEADVRDAQVSESSQPVQQEPAVVTEKPETDEPVAEAEQVIQAGEAETLFHVVQPKENLYRLSLKYNIKLNTLKEWNNLDENGSINVGMKLWLVPPAQQTN
ncbi:MAG TPA: type IV pilus biogenesis/stability protein PilW [Alteromonas sp.]|jgi:type IV pilus assembly protein PilF|nr:type IV pilus biogenesis/stability protein PilW [Alteromonas sp.]HCA77000.1 type IV pilus biogenesis/stability protein PilW [Alteromonas sp.]HCL11457.1 type IV pilus biogenesis/stability protein PilW [Alteromonas sp.]HCV18866.1 type IV pilus biogenesis/stability protein PilW [Alteromonas sp.]